MTIIRYDHYSPDLFVAKLLIADCKEELEDWQYYSGEQDRDTEALLDRIDAFLNL